MTIEADLDTALGALVDSRIYGGTFPQPPGRAAPTWPGIRRTLIGIPNPDLCGDGGDETADFRLQLDLVVSEASGYESLRTLRGQVMTAMSTFSPPAIWDGEQYFFDEETRTHRCVLDYLIYPSSLPESP